MNKIDRTLGELEELEDDLIDKGIDLEAYGGNIPLVPISAKLGKNIDLLIELIFEENKRLNF